MNSQLHLVNSLEHPFNHEARSNSQVQAHFTEPEGEIPPSAKTTSGNTTITGSKLTPITSYIQTMIDGST